MRNKILWDISAGVLIDGILIPHSLPDFLSSILKLIDSAFTLINT